MRNSLYDALEVNQSSSVATIQAALRGVVRRFWSVPRDASGDSEEAVRFAALAASILVDQIRRKDYDVALNPGVGAGPWRLPIGAIGGIGGAGGAVGREGAVEIGSTQSRVQAEGGVELSQLSVEATPMKSLPGVDALAEPLADGSSWASPMIWMGFAAAAMLLIFGSVVFVRDWFQLAMLPAVGVAAIAVVASLFAAFVLSRPKESTGPAAGLSRLGIIKWRREGSIFIGVPPPQHDTAWIFKLRLMELTRSAAGFVTATNVARRLLARAIDYALIALLIYGVIWGIDTVTSVADPFLIVLRSPFVVPIFVALAAIPLEAFALRVFRTTPGKWLLGLVVVTGVTCPADHVKPGAAQLSWARSVKVAWSGAALGVWPVALIWLISNWRDTRDREASWDVGGDSVVMARPMTMATVATGVAVIAATALILLSGWRRDYAEFWPYAVTWSITSESKLSKLFAPSPAEPPGSSTVPPASPVAAPPAFPALPATSEPAPMPAPPVKAPNVTITKKAAPAASPNTSPPLAQSVAEAEAQMEQQASAAHARRVRIDGYARQAENARRDGSYAGLQGNCQRWTVDQPGSAEAWRCLGLAQYQNGAGRDALPALRQSLKLGAKDPQVEDAILKIFRP